MVHQSTGDFLTVIQGRRQPKIGVCPQVVAHQSERVAEGGQRLGIPGSAADGAVENGVRGSIECGAHAPHCIPGDSVLRPLPFWTDRSVTVHGTHGYAQVITGAGWRAMTKTSGGQVLGGSGTFDPSHEQPRYLHELADWLDGTIPTHACNGDMRYHGFEALMALDSSSLETRRVDLPLGTLPQGARSTRLRAALPPSQEYAGQ